MTSPQPHSSLPSPRLLPVVGTPKRKNKDFALGLEKAVHNERWTTSPILPSDASLTHYQRMEEFILIYCHVTLTTPMPMPETDEYQQIAMTKSSNWAAKYPWAAATCRCPCLAWPWYTDNTHTQKVDNHHHKSTSTCIECHSYFLPDNQRRHYVFD